MEEYKQNNEQNNEHKNEFKFTHTISCPNCPINCYSIQGAIKHAETCNKKRRNGNCCLCKNENPPDYYNPKENRYWFICWKCYKWAKQKIICL